MEQPGGWKWRKEGRWWENCRVQQLEWKEQRPGLGIGDRQGGRRAGAGKQVGKTATGQARPSGGCKTGSRLRLAAAEQEEED